MKLFKRILRSLFYFELKTANEHYGEDNVKSRAIQEAINQLTKEIEQ